MRWRLCGPANEILVSTRFTWRRIRSLQRYRQQMPTLSQGPAPLGQRPISPRSVHRRRSRQQPTAGPRFHPPVPAQLREASRMDVPADATLDAPTRGRALCPRLQHADHRAQAVCDLLGALQGKALAGLEWRVRCVASRRVGWAHGTRRGVGSREYRSCGANYVMLCYVTMLRRGRVHRGGCVGQCEGCLSGTCLGYWSC